MSEGEEKNSRWLLMITDGSAEANLTCKFLLTDTKNCGIITTKDKEKDTLKNRKGNVAMKKATMKAIVDYIEENDVTELSEVKDELVAELAKGEEKAEANRAVYAEMHDKVMECIRTANAPVTAQEIADATGIARGKIVHGLTKLWDAEVTKDRSGKAILYGIA